MKCCHCTEPIRGELSTRVTIPGDDHEHNYHDRCVFSVVRKSKLTPTEWIYYACAQAIGI